MTEEENLIYEKIKAIRRLRNLSQSDFSKKTKIDYTLYTYAECQKSAFNIKTIHSIAKALNVEFLSIVDNDIDLISFAKIVKG